MLALLIRISNNVEISHRAGLYNSHAGSCRMLGRLNSGWPSCPVTGHNRNEARVFYIWDLCILVIVKY